MNNINEKVLRYFDAEVRAKDEEGMMVTGYALKFEKPTQIGSDKWGWIEKISRKAMETAKLNDVILSFNHSFSSVLSRTTNKSLVLSVDDVGLKFEAEIVDTSYGKDVYKLIKEGLINRMSFYVEVLKSEWKIDEKGKELDQRTITSFGRFYDIAAVTFPAYDDTIISARSDLVVIDADVRTHFEKREYERQIVELEKITGGTHEI